MIATLNIRTIRETCNGHVLRDFPFRLRVPLMIRYDMMHATTFIMCTVWKHMFCGNYVSLQSKVICISDLLIGILDLFHIFKLLHLLVQWFRYMCQKNDQII